MLLPCILKIAARKAVKQLIDSVRAEALLAMLLQR